MSPAGEQQERADVDNSAWDAGKAWAAGAASDNPAAFYKAICAGKKSGDPSTQGAWALPHHYAPGKPPNAAGVRNALSRLPGTQGLTNKAEAQKHLDAHMSVISPAKGASAAEVRERRAEALQGNRRELSGGAARLEPFAANWRAALVQWQGAERHQLDGYASVTGIEYEMWDMFGPYGETVHPDAFNDTLAAQPDVAFLVNHKGITMARTTNGTLKLEADPRGLHSTAYVNPDRTDVRDLVIAIDDKNVTEMSFAFMITDGGWDDDFEKFEIKTVDLDRGDVSAVNYGANPYTDIAARSRQILGDLDHLPEGARRAAFQRLSAELSACQCELAESRAVLPDPRGAVTPPPDGVSRQGRSVEYYEHLLRL